MKPATYNACQSICKLHVFIIQAAYSCYESDFFFFFLFSCKSLRNTFGCVSITKIKALALSKIYFHSTKLTYKFKIFFFNWPLRTGIVFLRVPEKNLPPPIYSKHTYTNIYIYTLKNSQYSFAHRIRTMMTMTMTTHIA